MGLVFYGAHLFKYKYNLKANSTLKMTLNNTYTKAILTFWLLLAFFSANSQNMRAIHREVCVMPSVVRESSGMVIASLNSIWTHGDSGNENKIFKVDSNGALLRTITIANAPNIDWEDMAIDENGDLWICDGGNNNNTRKDLKIIKIANPELHDSSSVHAQFVFYSFPDQTAFPPPSSKRNFDVEALIRYKDSLLLFTKDRSSPISGYTKLYRLSIVPGTYVAELLDSFYLGNSNQLARVTAADMEVSTGRIALLTLSQIVVFSNYQGSDFFGGDVSFYLFKNPTNQVEALVFIDSNKFYMTDEVPGALYEVKLDNASNSSSVSNVNSNKFRVYYEPSLSILTIFGVGQIEFKCTILDSQSKVVHSQDYIGIKIELPLNLSVGVYYIKFEIHGLFWIEKLLVR